MKPLGIKVTLIQPGPTATAFLANLDLAVANPAYDGTVRVVQRAIGELPASAFTDPAEVVKAILGVVDAHEPPLRLAIGRGGAEDMRAALNARLLDLNTWTTVDSVGA